MQLVRNAEILSQIDHSFRERLESFGLRECVVIGPTGQSYRERWILVSSKSWLIDAVLGLMSEESKHISMMQAEGGNAAFIHVAKLPMCQHSRHTRVSRVTSKRSLFSNVPGKLRAMMIRKFASTRGSVLTR